MRFIVAALVAFVAFPAFAKEKPDVGQALDAWVDAVESGNAGNVLRLYDDKAIMISTFAQAPLTKRTELAKYYRQAVANPDIEVEVTEQHPRLYGDMAVNTGQYTFHYTQDGEPVTIPARFSFTYTLKNDRWIIVDHHSSRVPLAKEAR